MQGDAPRARQASIRLLKATHTPGRHCASTALADLVNFRGIEWSEARCFGIGCGLGIWYFRGEGKSPERLVHVRSADIEEQFFRRIGQSFRWRRRDDPLESERDLIAALDGGDPAIVQSDICHLPYYNTTTHFPGHVIAVWGYDMEKQVFFVTDTEREKLIEVPFGAMKKARYVQMGFFDIRGNMYAPHGIIAPDNIPEIMRSSIIDQSRRLLDGSQDYQGIAALRKWRSELGGWKGFKDRQWTARFTYQVIERRGTGGGGFRLMYADFLDEAASALPNAARLGLPSLMREAASAWSGLAMALKELSERTDFDPGAAGEALERVMLAESEYHRAAISL